MTSDHLLPAPLLPVEVDLRKLEYMPLKVEQLCNSKLAKIAVRSPRIAASGLFLWAFSWHQVPAGSIENDDDTLRTAACCSPAAWAQPGVKEQILRGWVLCSDNRWWHPVVSAVAWSTWVTYVDARYHAGRRKVFKRGERSGSNEDKSSYPTKDQWLQAIYPKTHALLEANVAATYQTKLPLVAATMPNVASDIPISVTVNVNVTPTDADDVAATSSVDGELPPPIADMLEDRRKRPKRGATPPPQKAAPPPSDFTAFIDAYKPPRTYSPLRSSLAFSKLVAKGTQPSVIIAAAKLYASERGDQVQNPERFLEETWRNYEAEARRLDDLEASLQRELEEAKRSWGQFAEPIIQEIGVGKFRAWFRRSRLIANGERFYVTAPSTLVRDQLETTFQAVLTKVLPMPFEIKLEADPNG